MPILPYISNFIDEKVLDPVKKFGKNLDSIARQELKKSGGNIYSTSGINKNQIDQEINALLTMRKIEWSRGYLWGCKFEAAPEPFSNWFPAKDIQIPTSTLVSDVLAVGQEELYYPKSSSPRSLSITMVDDVHGTLEDWFRKWVQTGILNEGYGVTPIGECSELFRFFRLNTMREVQYIRSYYVYPNNNITVAYNSSSEVREFTVELVIVGEY